MTSFNYSPLHQNQIRLLRPRSISRELLSFELFHSPTAPAASYAAVSYTWGECAPTECIYVNNQPFPVRRNLWSCLYYLSQQVHETCLWIDAICIDQTNIPERNAQVRLMDSIYRNARSVSVWLGLPPISAFEQDYAGTHAVHRLMDDREVDWCDAEDLQDLANRPYWGRYWVIQEFLLGQDVRLHCGNNSIDWQDFKDMLGRDTKANYFDTDFDYTACHNGDWAAWPLTVGRHVDRHPESPQPLCKLLVGHRMSRCKDPRDRVFALIGLVGTDEQRLLKRFLPDYAMSEDDVVVTALAHVNQVDIGEHDSRDDERLFLGLGVECARRRKKLKRRAEVYDYMCDVPPSRYFDPDLDDTYEEETSSRFGRGSCTWLLWIVASLLLVGAWKTSSGHVKWIENFFLRARGWMGLE